MALKKDFELNKNIFKSVKIQIPKPVKIQQAIDKLFKRSNYEKIVQS